MLGRGSIVGGVWTEKGADGGVTWDDYILSDHGIPLVREVREGHGPKVLFGIRSTFGYEGETPLWCMIQVPFVEGTLMVDCDFGVTLENVRESREGIGWRVGRDCFGR